MKLMFVVTLQGCFVMRLGKFVVCALAILAAPLSARASTVTAELTSVTNGGVAVTPYLGTTAMTGAGLIGQYNWTVVNSPSPLGNPGASFYTFCIEVTQDINFSVGYTYTLTPTTSAPNPTSPFLSGHMSTQSADALSRLWSAHIGDVLGASSSGQELFNAAAFQLAVWKLVYDTTGTDDSDVNSAINTLTVNLYGAAPSSWTAGMTQATLNSTATTWANAAWDSSGAGTSLIALTSPDFQDQITTVPIPASLAGGGALLGLMAIVRLRRAYVSRG